MKKLPVGNLMKIEVREKKFINKRRQITCVYLFLYKLTVLSYDTVAKWDPFGDHLMHMTYFEWSWKIVTSGTSMPFNILILKWKW